MKNKVKRASKKRWHQEIAGKAWLVRWSTAGEHVAHLVERYSPQGEVVAILSARKSYEDICEYTKNIYELSALSLLERIFFASYNSGERKRKDFFSSSVPTSTHYQSLWYRTLAKKDLNNHLDDTLRKEWEEAWNNNARYITIGYNPFLEAMEIFDLRIEEDEGGKEIISWLELSDGAKRSVTYRPKT